MSTDRGTVAGMQRNTLRPVRARTFSALLIAALLGLALLASGNARADGGDSAPDARDAAVSSNDPSLTLRGPFTPRVLEVPGTEGRVELRDANGTLIPLTGEGMSFSEGSVSLYPPKLPEGVYQITYPGGQRELRIGEGALTGLSADAAEGTWPSSLLPALLLIPVGGLALLLLRRGRRISAVLLVGACAAGAVVLVASPDSGSLLGDPDPCIAAANWETHETCMYSHVRAVLETSDLPTAVARMERLAAAPESRWALGCHEVAHYLGQIGWRYVETLQEAVEAGTVSCSFGYFHGMLESMGTYLTDETFPTRVLAVCPLVAETFFPGRNDGEAGPGRECVHGIGHAAMWRYNENLPRASAVCNGIEQPADREECVAGATMSWIFAREQARTEGTERDLPEPRVANALELCDAPWGSSTPGCVEGALTGTTFEEYPAAVRWCGERSALAETCGGALIRRLVYWEGTSVPDLASAAGELCAQLSGERYPVGKCVEWLAWFHMYVRRDYPATKNLCAAVGYVPECTRGIALFYGHARSTGDTSVGEAPAELPSLG